MENSISGMIDEQNEYVGYNSDDSEMEENLQHEAGWSEDEFDVSHYFSFQLPAVQHHQIIYGSSCHNLCRLRTMNLIMMTTMANTQTIKMMRTMVNTQTV
jgi:hypothetical protein